ncbi:phospholipase A2 inhibitor and Ly6/PLAUR domain-containing protein-like [Pituophis catenifer annectens]|uniref:phospholipase A2 inhibitor and Ly6/PLAUR domain-containing protein-like n=1 Tax=Pituophis catenifer annectens TaxID=94852 RepID=UPI003990EA19
MSARIFVLCLLSSVISTAASLNCQSCFACKEECKNENMKLVECGPDEKYCLSLSFRSSMTSAPLSFTYKSCATDKQCSKAYYGLTSVAGKFQQLRVECCETDGCNTAPLPIPRRELMKPNGFYCPGSYEQNGSSEQNGSVLCLGDEDQCFSAKFNTYALSAFRSTVTAQGCANKNTCTYPEGETELGHGLLRLNVERVECQNPKGLEGWNGFSRIFGRGWN